MMILCKCFLSVLCFLYYIQLCECACTTTNVYDFTAEWAGDGFHLSFSNEGRMLVGTAVVDNTTYSVFEQTSPSNFEESAQIQTSSLFGTPFTVDSTDFDGPTIVFGEAGAVGGFGAIYVFQESFLNENDFTYVAELTSSDGGNGDLFGRNSIVEGVYIIGSAHYHDLSSTSSSDDGSLYIFAESSLAAGDFVEVQKVIDSQINFAYGYDEFAESLAMSGNTLVSGAWNADVYSEGDDVGAVIVYRQFTAGGSFDQIAKLEGNSNNINLGNSVAVDGAIVAGGAPQDHELGTYVGSIFIWREDAFESGNYVSMGKLQLPDNFQANDNYGYILRLYRGILLASSRPFVRAAQVNVYIDSALDAGDFSLSTTLTSVDPYVGDLFGYFLGISDNNEILVGGLPNGNEFSTQHASVYHFSCFCASSPCLNGATCSDFGASGTCECVFGYEGDLCELDIDECISSPCLNGATCADEIGGYSCTCLSGYEGSECQSEVNECLSSPCLNGATCVDTGANSFLCVCSGFDGDLCQTDIDDCISSPCLNDGVCSDTGTNLYSCDCTGTGFEGSECQTELDSDDCVNNVCQNNATCVDGYFHYTCVCALGFEGEYCNIDIDDCSSSPCLNGATCFDTGINSVICECLPDYEGLFCEIDANDCMSFPCQNDGVCIDLGINAFECSCPSTHTGAMCETELDLGPSEFPPVEFKLTFSGFANSNDTAESFAIELKQTLLPAALGGGPSDYEVTDLEQGDGSYEYSIVTANRNGYAYSEIEQMIVDYDEIGNRVTGTIKVREVACPSTHTGAMCETELDLGPSEFPPVEFKLTFSGFANSNDTAESFAIELKQTLLPAALGGGPSDYEVTVLEQGDGSYEYSIVTANRNGYAYSEIEQMIVDYDEIGNRVTGTIKVREVVDESSASGAYHLHGSIAMTVIVMWSMTLLM